MIHMYTFIGVIASYIYEIKLLFIVSFITPTHVTDDCFSSVVSKKDNKVVKLVQTTHCYSDDLE